MEATYTCPEETCWWIGPFHRFEDERITLSVFHHFELRRRAERSEVLMGGGTRRTGQGRAALQEALALLQRIGFTLALPLLGRVACLNAEKISALARVNDEYEMLSLLLGGDDSLAVKELSDQLLANLPGARRHRHLHGTSGGKVGLKRPTAGQ